MGSYLKSSDCLKLEVEELELLLGPEDSEVTVRKILRHVTRRGNRIFEIFNTQEKSEHSAASKVRWDERQRLKMAQEERVRGSATEADDGDDFCWTETFVKRLQRQC